MSTRFVAALSAQERAKVDGQIRGLIAAEPELRGQGRGDGALCDGGVCRDEGQLDLWCVHRRLAGDEQ